MSPSDPLPDDVNDAFPIWLARLNGVSRGRLRGSDLESPFYGVRMRGDAVAHVGEIENPYERQRELRVARARQYAPRLHSGHFFSHETAASIWGAPLPLAFTPAGEIAGAADLELHVSALGHVPFPRTSGIRGHRTLQRLTELRDHDGLRVSSPAATWASLGALPLFDLIALGDYFCRRWRPGYGRPSVDREPLASIDDLRDMVEAGRRHGVARLREALGAIREDSWSPRESQVRCILMAAGLPEPELNVDIFDAHGSFLGCVDMVYPVQRVAIEYLGMLHGEQWAQDVERLAALRSAGWTVIEVTSPLLKRPDELVARVRAALRGRLGS